MPATEVEFVDNSDRCPLFTCPLNHAITSMEPA
jgi:hypothetical protein